MLSKGTKQTKSESPPGPDGSWGRSPQLSLWGQVQTEQRKGKNSLKGHPRPVPAFRGFLTHSGGLANSHTVFSFPQIGSSPCGTVQGKYLRPLLPWGCVLPWATPFHAKQFPRLYFTVRDSICFHLKTEDDSVPWTCKRYICLATSKAHTGK